MIYQQATPFANWLKSKHQCDDISVSTILRDSLISKHEELLDSAYQGIIYELAAYCVASGSTPVMPELQEERSPAMREQQVYIRAGQGFNGDPKQYLAMAYKQWRVLEAKSRKTSAYWRKRYQNLKRRTDAGS